MLNHNTKIKSTNTNVSEKLSFTFNTEVMNTDSPIRTKIINPVTRCSRIPKNFGCSPGAEHSDSTFRLLTWLIDRTVAATNHGKPMREHIPSITPTMSRSRWYPQPFCKIKQTNHLISFLFMRYHIYNLPGK